MRVPMLRPTAALRWPAFVLALVMALVLAACGGGGGGGEEPVPPGGTVTGLVVSAADGAPLSGVTVSAAGRSTTTGADGRYTLTGVAPADPQPVQYRRDGHAPTFASLKVVLDVTTTADVRLTPVGATATFSNAAGATVTMSDSPAQVVLPPGGLVTTTGAAPSGNVTARITPIDPAADPANMPGNYTARTASGATETIESFGALNVQLTDATGARLDLATGQTATIRIPLATRSGEAPATMPLYWFNETTGFWVREGVATLRGTAPDQYYEGTVSHFTTWNVDRPMETIFVNGCLQESNGTRVPNAVVESEGVDYSGSANAVTDANGNFRVAMRRGGVALISAELLGRTSNAVQAGPSQTDITLPACLVMGNGAPVIVQQPQDQTAGETGYVVFQVLAKGSAPLRYQWQRNGVAIPGATGSSLVLTGLLNADNGSTYRVVVTNPVGSATSNAATLTVRSLPPLILNQPLAQTVDFGAPASFSVVAATQGEPIRYQWTRNDQAIAGATEASYTLPAAALADSGVDFRVRLTNDVGTVTSDPARLTVRAPVAPQITQQPVAASVTAGSTASFSVQATGTPAPSYQWRRNGTNITGATAASYTTPATVLGDSGAVFSVVVSNAGGSVTSTDAALTVSAAPVPPQIAQQPQNATVNAGATATFSVTANGSGLSYQWLRNGATITGATAASYTTPATTLADTGASFTVRVSNAAGNVTSNAATLTVQAVAPQITQQPASTTVAVGQTAVFSVTATGTPPLTYQWRRNGADITGATAATYTTPAVTAGDDGAQFSVVVGNAGGSVTSNVALLSITGAGGGSGSFLAGFSGTSTQGAAIVYANGSQTIDFYTLNVVRSQSPTGAGVLEPAGTVALTLQPVLEGTVSGGNVSGLRARFITYFRNGRLYRADLAATGDAPEPTIVSTLTPAQVCGSDGSPVGPENATGLNIADPTRTWIFLKGPGADGACDTADDRFRAVRMNMAPAADAMTIGEPLAEIISPAGVFQGLIVREGSQVRRLDADLGSPVNLFSLAGGTFINDGLAFGTAPGIWMFSVGNSLYAYDLAGTATQPTLLATLTADELDASTRPVAVGAGGVGYVALAESSQTRLLRVATNLTTSTLATVPGTVVDLDVTPTRLVYSVRDALGRSTLRSLPLAGGSPVDLLADDTTWRNSVHYVAGENVYAVQTGSVSGGVVYRTVVLASDGSNRETRTNTTIVGTLLPASASVDRLSSEWYAVILADNTSAANGFGGATLRAEAGATRTPLVTYGAVQSAPPAQVFPGGLGLLQYGQPGLLLYVPSSGSLRPSLDLLYIDSDVAGLTKVTNLNPAPQGAPGDRARAQQVPMPSPLRAMKSPWAR